MLECLNCEDRSQFALGDAQPRASLRFVLMAALVSWPWQYAGPKNSTAIAHFTTDADPFAVQNCAAAVERSCDAWPCPSGGATSYHGQDGGCRDQRDLCKSIPNLMPMVAWQ